MKGMSRKAVLEDARHVVVVLEERQLREIALVTRNRSEFIRDAVELALGRKDIFGEVQNLREENKALREERERLRREKEELKRQIASAKKLIEVLKSQRR